MRDLLCFSCSVSSRFFWARQPLALLENAGAFVYMVKNTNLQAAKNLKDDEFYTTYESIVEELSHYAHHFKNKTVLCNCDDPYESNFCKYFLRNFNKLGLSRLICTSYCTSKVIATQLNLFDVEEEILHKGQGYVIDVSYITDGTEELSEIFINHWLIETKPIRKLKGNGDFRSKECIDYLTQSDIIVTNPPFSLFKEMVSLLVQHDKKYLLIGNQNALTYREIFPLIQNNLAWTGYRFGDMKFRVPSNSAPRKTRYWVDASGQKWRSLGNAMWLTNLDIEKKHKWLKYSIINLIVGIILCASELIAKSGVGIIPFGSNAESMSKITLGGNVLVYIYPVLQAGGDVFTDMSFEVHMNLLALIIMFLLRFIVIIPIVNFIEARKKNDLDYREYFNEDKFS